MRTASLNINVGGAGNPSPVSELSELTAQITGTFSGTLLIEGKLDPSASWITLYTLTGSPAALPVAASLAAVMPTISQIRANITSYVSGAPVVVVAGHFEGEGISDTLAAGGANQVLHGSNVGYGAVEAADLDMMTIGPLFTLAARHAVFIAKATVHQELDTLLSLPDLLSGDVLATALAQAATIHAALLSHAADAGASALVDAPHRLADTGSWVTGLNGAGVPTDLPTLISWIALCKAFLIGHAAAPGAHGADDTSADGTGFTLTVDPPVTQADANSDINAIKYGYNGHADQASLI